MKTKAGRIGRPLRRGGFTLVELLLVLVILATLAAIVLPKLVGRTEEAKIKATKTQISAIESALDLFEVDNGYFPETSEGLYPLVVQPQDAENWKQYLKGLPMDAWKNEFTYERPGQYNPDGYDIVSAGPDGRFNTDDDITNVDDVITAR
jgi:general secretion pathway protein G